MKQQISKYYSKIPPAFRGIILFVVCLLASNYLWKLTIHGDDIETTIVVDFLGIDISQFFKITAYAFTEVSHDILSILNIDNMLANNSIIFPNGHCLHIVAGCTAVKQFFIAAVILAFARGPWLRKLWYIPLSILILICFNIFRLVFLGWIVRDYFQMFDFFHLYVIKYMFYGTILILWYIWDEHLRNL